MRIKAVGRRCAVDFGEWSLPVSNTQALQTLRGLGFQVMQISVLELARQCIRVSEFRAGANPADAPGFVDCSSFTQWLYAQIGIELPRRAIEQWRVGELVPLKDAQIGDLVFVKGRMDFTHDEIGIPIGHVGFVTGEGTVIHAAHNPSTVIESPFRRFNDMGGLQGVRRYAPLDRVVTLVAPEGCEFETSHDLRRITLQALDG